MRLRGSMLLGVLAMSAAGCGEVAAPSEAVARDLDLLAPSMHVRMDSTRHRTWDEAIPVEDLDRARRLSDESAQEEIPGPALLFSTYVLGHWNLDELWIQYGFYGAGTGYTMQPRVEVKSQFGHKLWERAGYARSENQPLYSFMRPTSEQLFATGIYCGSNAAVNVQFEVRSRGRLFGEEVEFTQRDQKQGVVVQQRCPPPPPELTGGGTDRVQTTDGTRVFLCQYELWTDLDGDVIDVFFFGCTEVSANLYYAE